jgi:beta-lactamase regulating signal transducer with metallopeptidase domain
VTMVLDTVLRSSLVLTIGFAIAVGLARQPAALRHWILAASIVLAAGQPAITRLLPSWTIAPSLMSSFEVVPVSPQVNTTTSFEVLSEEPRSVVPARGGVSNIAIAIWIAGVVVSLATLMFGVAWLLWLSHRSRPAGRRWLEAEATVRSALGLAAPVRIRVTRHPALLVTWGAINPVILLPADADSWPAERVSVVLAHEMAHLARRDWLTQLAAEIVRAIHWFNPLFWLACARLRQESEHASDDIVLDLGFGRTSYAAHLVDLARVFSAHGRTWLPAPSMARPSTLERRVRNMLNPQTNRGPLSLTRRVAVVLLLTALALPIASASQGSATPSGTVSDPTGRLISGVSVRLSALNGEALYQTQTDVAGMFQFPSIPSGEYMLGAHHPGFLSVRRRVSITGATPAMALGLQVGNLSETVTVRGGKDAIDGPRSEERASQFGTPVCTRQATGGHIVPPRKIRDVRPRYRQAWVDAGLEGRVLLQARIGFDGRIREVEAVSPVNADLEEEAIGAVSQWEFTPTWLNCEPVEVRMFVTVAFTAER